MRRGSRTEGGNTMSLLSPLSGGAVDDLNMVIEDAEEN